VDKKKPDPTIYNVAAQRLGVDPADCIVVEDSIIGLKAALGAGMRCIITYTPSTKQQVGHYAGEYVYICVGTHAALQPCVCVHMHMRLACRFLQCGTHKRRVSVQLMSETGGKSIPSVAVLLRGWLLLHAYMQAFDGADMIMHELASNVLIQDLMERPAAVQDDRQGAASRLVSSSY
jgi:hypothetical protein